MSLPEHRCQGASVGPWSVGQCRICWLAFNTTEYGVHWLGVTPVNPLSIKLVAPTKKSDPLPCIHRGQPTGERRDCETCGGRVHVPLVVCAVHTICTTHLALSGVACCAKCPDYSTR